MNLDFLDILLEFLAGLSLFIFGMNVMAEGLQQQAGPRMKSLLETLTKTKFLGVVFGAVVTAIIQSSSATTVMVVGFVNAGLMTLQQSVGVIMGANIGTTATAWLVASMDWFDMGSVMRFLSPSFYAPIAATIGVFMAFFSNKKRTRQIGSILAGFGILFIGMNLMSAGAKPLADIAEFRNMFVSLGSKPILAFLAGLLVTAVIQSSSASVGILQSLALAGLVPYSAAIYIILGQNVGTCVTALLSSIGANKNARAASYIHLIFNLIGSFVFMIIASIAFKTKLSIYESVAITATQISIVHTVYNVLNTVMQYNFTDKLISISSKLAGSTEEVDDKNLVHLDDRLLDTPAAAIQGLEKEILRMGFIAKENIKLSVSSLFDQDKKTVKKVLDNEAIVNLLNKEISRFLVKLGNTHSSEKENVEISSMFLIINDIERISDHCDNISTVLDMFEGEIVLFSEQAKEELENLSDKCESCISYSLEAFENKDKNLAGKAINLEDEIDNLEKKYRLGHIERLQNNICTVNAGVVFLDTLTNLERISDHAKNIAEEIVL